MRINRNLPSSIEQPARSKTAGSSEYDEPSDSSEDGRAGRSPKPENPEDKEARIERLRLAVASGKYRIDAVEIAERIIQTHTATTLLQSRPPACR